MNDIARCYIRVSFSRNGETKESPDTQKAQIRAWCERHGYTPEWYFSRVRSAVQRWRTYAGHLVGGDASDDDVEIIVRDAWAPILDLDLIHRVRDVCEMRSFSKYRPPREYLLSTFLVCAECGSPLYGDQGDYYSHYVRGSDHGRSIYIEEADETIAEIVMNLDYEQVATQIEARVSELVRPSQPESSPALERLRELEEQHAGLLELAGRMESERLYEKIVAVEKEMEQIEAQLTPEAPAPVTTMAVDELLAIPDWYEAGSVAERREVLSTLVDEIKAHCIERWVEVRFREDWHEYFGESIRRDLPSRRPPTAEAVLKLRAATGWKQRVLAEQLGLSRKTVSRYERGLSIPNTEHSERLRRLAEKVAPQVAEEF